MSSNMLEELERKAKDPIAKMDVNLKRSYHNMRRFVKSATSASPFNSATVTAKSKKRNNGLE